MNAAMPPSQTPKPFSKELDPSLCYEFREHREASARLDLMIQHRTLGVLTGEVGGGKSTLIRRLFASLDPMSYLPIYLCYASLKPREFYGGFVGGGRRGTGLHGFPGTQALAGSRSQSFRSR
jgi:MoxR-like ATPase